MNKLKKHIRSDPNSKYHAAFGFAGCLITAVFLGLLNSRGVFMTGGLLVHILVVFLSSFVVGIGIELVQRIQRIGAGQNTIEESILDICTTGFWWLWNPR